MTGLTFAHLGWIHLAWAAIAMVIAVAWLQARGGRRLGRFIDSIMQKRLVHGPGRGRQRLGLALMALCLAAATVALLRPQLPGQIRQVAARHYNADVIVALDVSNSMLAEDAAPNRLARAKAEILAMLDKLDHVRVGLVAFAGKAALVCPITGDEGFFRLALDGADPTSVSRGGTNLGDAIRTAVRAFPPSDGAKIVLLITDGEDHDSYPREAAKEAAKAGVRIIAVGFGSEQGSEIRITDPVTGIQRTITDKSGNPVISRIDGALLKDIALATKGAYVPAGVDALDLRAIVDAHIGPMIDADAQPTVKRVPVELYPWAIAGAAVALFFAVWLAGARVRRARP